MVPRRACDSCARFAQDPCGFGVRLFERRYALIMASKIRTIPTLDEVKLRRCLAEVEDGYLDNPYHNNLHGADVAQSIFSIARTGDLHDRLSHWQDVAAILSGLVHDVGHFGLTNPFLKSTNHELALTYFYRSPLESMHISKAFTILAKEECNFLGGKLETDVLSSDDWKKARELMVNMILATDMANHGVDLIELEHVLKAGSVDLSKPERATLILKVCLHAADISNPAKPWDNYNKWTDRVLQEFHAQGDIEKSLGLPISPGFDREKCTNIKYVVHGEWFAWGVRAGGSRTRTLWRTAYLGELYAKLTQTRHDQS